MLEKSRAFSKRKRTRRRSELFVKIAVSDRLRRRVGLVHTPKRRLHDIGELVLTGNVKELIICSICDPVIRLENGDVCAFCLVNTPINRFAIAFVCFVDHAHPRVFGTKILQDGKSCIGRAVV